MTKKFNHKHFQIKFFAVGIATVLGLGMATTILTSPAYGPTTRATNECPLSELKNAMGAIQGEKNYDINLDIDGDRQITSRDYQIICNGSTRSAE